jgi:hypothetical protein
VETEFVLSLLLKTEKKILRRPRQRSFETVYDDLTQRPPLSDIIHSAEMSTRDKDKFLEHSVSLSSAAFLPMSLSTLNLKHTPRGGSAAA